MRTDKENKDLIDRLFTEAECVTCRDKNFVSLACKTLNISTLKFFQLISEMAKEGYRYA